LESNLQTPGGLPGLAAPFPSLGLAHWAHKWWSGMASLWAHGDMAAHWVHKWWSGMASFHAAVGVTTCGPMVTWRPDGPRSGGPVTQCETEVTLYEIRNTKCETEVTLYEIRNTKYEKKNHLALRQTNTKYEIRNTK